ncbi:cytochrome P450 [Allorhizocola rhizosphaerae]|uniref:cytochrome P450 n=1 Tax=Allorhizocola rhizosphaerae TaxID=1872709 RepID=UPI000E3B9B68|nr:cytochrome P450 [Allorhizocola rhizosphaerae]
MKFPFSEPDRLNLDPAYSRLQDEPMVKIKLPYGEEAWLATRYTDVRTVLGDLRFSRAMAATRDEPRSVPQQMSDGILAMDPPEHTRLRSLVARAFTTRRVEQLRPRVREIADELLDDMQKAGPPADLVELFATPLPIRVICEMLGVPHTDQDKFHTWTEAVVSTTSLTPETILQYRDSLYAYMADLIEQRRQAPTEDLISTLIRARDEDQSRLTEDEMVRLAMGLLAAGHETTVTQIPNFVYVLLTHPDKMAELVSDPSLIPAAVEELMRYVPLGATVGFARYATEDMELGGVHVKAGEPVLGAIGAANRDPRAFARPDELDFKREANQHMGFGHGVHHCIGAPLARMELQVALGVLLSRLPGLRLAVPEEDLKWKRGLIVRGLKEMPVTWERP